jgi:hypothetical protein
VNDTTTTTTEGLVAYIPIIDTMREMDAVYWGVTVDRYGKIIPDDFGKETFDAPIPLKVFWIDRNELVLMANGEQRVSKAQVFTGDDTPVGGMMLKGTMAAIPVGMEDNPRGIFGCSRIIHFDKIPSIPPGVEQQFVRKAYL